MSSFGGSGVLYAYDVATAAWSLLVPNLQNQEPAAMAWHPVFDGVFALLVDAFGSSPPRVRWYDAQGSTVATVNLALPVFDDLLDEHQLYVAGAGLIYVGPPRELLGFRLRHCYVIDPTTGDVLSASFLFD